MVSIGANLCFYQICDVTAHRKKKKSTQKLKNFFFPVRDLKIEQNICKNLYLKMTREEVIWGQKSIDDVINLEFSCFERTSRSFFL